MALAEADQKGKYINLLFIPAENRGGLYQMTVYAALTTFDGHGKAHRLPPTIRTGISIF